MGSSAGRMLARKARRSRRLELVQGSGSRPQSARGVCGGSPQNCQVTWLSHKTKIGVFAGVDGIWARREALMPGDTWWDRRACVGRTQTAAMAWLPDEEDRYFTIFPLRGVYPPLCSRGTLVICPNQRDFIYIALEFQGNLSIQIASHFPTL
jgi:hypothetical protein